MRYSIFLVLLVSCFSFADNLPVNRGKCGNLQDINSGEDDFKDCRIGDVIIVPQKTMPMFCDFRYEIVEYSKGASGSSYACVLRALYKDRKN